MKGRAPGLWFLIPTPSELLGQKLSKHCPHEVPGQAGGIERGTLWSSMECTGMSRDKAVPTRGVTEVYTSYYYF